MSNIYAEILERVERGEALTLKTELCGSEGLIAEGLKKTLAPYAPQTDKRGRYFADVTLTETEGKITVGEPFSPPERLIVLGAGHIAVPVCDFAAKSGFEVYVCDDRPAFANTARFPLAREVLCDSFESCIDRLRLTRYDYVVVITRGHVHDADCLRAIFKGTQPAYLGLIGSRRRVAGLMRLLRDEGYDAEKLAAIHAPIGLAIGAVTPAEIAVSICAQLVEHRRALPETEYPGTLLEQTNSDLSAIRYLAENAEPKALLLVLTSTGSTPVKSGALMAVNKLGTGCGTIGGGCSEAAAMQRARKIIGSGESCVIEIDMTNDVAADEGMVCGGTMRVLVEDGTDPHSRGDGPGLHAHGSV